MPTGIYDHSVRVVHGHNHRGKTTPEYRAYFHAKARCQNPKDKGFRYYGGRGIQFRFNSFVEFIEHIGLRPTKKHSLDRTNNEGPYEVGNVRWATKDLQNKNRRGNGKQGKHYKTHCNKGHRLAPDNLVRSLAKRGIHRCRICAAAYFVTYRKVRNGK